MRKVCKFLFIIVSFSLAVTVSKHSDVLLLSNRENATNTAILTNSPRPNYHVDAMKSATENEADQQVSPAKKKKTSFPRRLEGSVFRKDHFQSANGKRKDPSHVTEDDCFGNSKRLTASMRTYDQYVSALFQILLHLSIPDEALPLHDTALPPLNKVIDTFSIEQKKKDPSRKRMGGLLKRPREIVAEEWASGRLWPNPHHPTNLTPLSGSALQRDNNNNNSSLTHDGGGILLEFGVYKGESLRTVATAATRALHRYQIKWNQKQEEMGRQKKRVGLHHPPLWIAGFDSFKGLPAAWHEYAKGGISASMAQVKVPPYVELVPGWFQDSIPKWLQEHQLNPPPRPSRHYLFINNRIRRRERQKDNIDETQHQNMLLQQHWTNNVTRKRLLYLHHDADLFLSTTITYQLLSHLIQSGTIILSHELIGYPSYREHELWANYLWQRQSGVDLCVVGSHDFARWHDGVNKKMDKNYFFNWTSGEYSKAIHYSSQSVLFLVASSIQMKQKMETNFAYSKKKESNDLQEREVPNFLLQEEGSTLYPRRITWENFKLASGRINTTTIATHNDDGGRGRGPTHNDDGGRGRVPTHNDDGGRGRVVVPTHRQNTPLIVFQLMFEVGTISTSYQKNQGTSSNSSSNQKNQRTSSNLSSLNHYFEALWRVHEDIERQKKTRRVTGKRKVTAPCNLVSFPHDGYQQRNTIAQFWDDLEGDDKDGNQKVDGNQKKEHGRPQYGRPQYGRSQSNGSSCFSHAVRDGAKIRMLVKFFAFDFATTTNFLQLSSTKIGLGSIFVFPMREENGNSDWRLAVYLWAWNVGAEVSVQHGVVEVVAM